MQEFYEPRLNLSDPEHHNTMGAVLSLRDPVDGEILRWAVEKMRARFPYFYVKPAYKGDDPVTVPNDLPMTVRNTWEPIRFHSEESNFHLGAWKYEGHRLAFEIPHALTDGAGFLPYVKSTMFLYLSKATGQTFDPAGFCLPGDEIPESETGNPFRELDFDSVEGPLYQKKPIPDFFRLANAEKADKTVFYLKLPEAQVMRCCRDYDGSPNVLMSVMLAKAARRMDPENEKPVTVIVCVNLKALLGVPHNYRMFVGGALLDFSKDREKEDISKACTIAHGQLMLQAQPENALWEIKQMMQMPELPSPDTVLASLCVSYVNSRSFGPLDPCIEEIYVVTSLSKLTDILCEISCFNHSFFVSFMQPYASEKYFRCFLDELDSAGIGYEVLRSELLRMCGI